MKETIQKPSKPIVGSYQLIALGYLVESKTNPRKDFDPGKLTELAQSIEQRGILQPLVVRSIGPTRTKYEVVAGARRLRAAHIAYDKNLAIEIPCIVKELDDSEVIEIQVIENNQREDIPPLEEAEGYAILLELKDEKGVNKYTVDSIALKVGKSDNYIRARLHLANLIPEAKKYLQTGEIYYTHARILSRLTQDQQKEALAFIFPVHQYRNKGEKLYPCSIDDLNGWILRNLETNLNNAAFPLDDAVLVKKAGACNVCPKNTACDGQLFPDYAKKKTCLDPVCFKVKTKQFELNRLNESLKKVTEDKDIILVSGYRYDDGSRKVGGVDKEVIGYGRWKQCKKSDPGAKKAILTSTRDEGKKGKEIYVKIGPKKNPQERASSGNTSATDQEKKRKLLQEKTQKINAIRVRIYQEMCKAPSKLDGGDKRQFISYLLDNLSWAIDDGLVKKALGVPDNIQKATDYLCKLKFEEAVKKMILMFLSNDVELESYNIGNHKSNNDSLFNNAKRLKVNIAAIEKEIEKETSPKPPTNKSGVSTLKGE